MKINLIFIIVVNALHFGLCDFIQLAVMLLPGQLKNENDTQKVCFFVLWHDLWFGIIFHITKVGMFFFSEVVGRYFSRGFIEKYNSFEAKVPLMEKQVFDFQLQHPWKTPVEECHCNESCWLLREICNLTSRTKFRVVQFTKDAFIRWNLGNAMLMQTLIVQRLM